MLPVTHTLTPAAAPDFHSWGNNLSFLFQFVCFRFFDVAGSLPQTRTPTLLPGLSRRQSCGNFGFKLFFKHTFLFFKKWCPQRTSCTDALGYCCHRLSQQCGLCWRDHRNFSLNRRCTCFFSFHSIVFLCLDNVTKEYHVKTASTDVIITSDW